MMQHITYVVQPGDTLSSIAMRFGVRIEDILNANPEITDPNILVVGQTIRIPRPGMPAEMPPTMPPTVPAPPGIPAMPQWCCLVLDPVEDRVPEPGVALVEPVKTGHIFVATMEMPQPSRFGSDFNIYAAWIMMRDGRVRDFIDLVPAQLPGFWVNHKDISGLERTDKIRVTPEHKPHRAEPTGMVVLQGRLTECR